MGDIDLLETVLEKDRKLIESVSSQDLSRPTACPDFDVRALVAHQAGWLQVFAAGAQGRAARSDPSEYAGTDPAADFRVAADEVVAGWRQHGVDRSVSLTGGAELPGQMVLDMTLMEYVTHGCDLALATGQPVPFADAELETTLDKARRTLPDEYRGEGQAFGAAIDVADDAPPLERLLGFMGRRRPSTT